MQVACLLIEQFPYQLHALSDPRLVGRSVVIANRAAGVVDASNEAAVHGVTVGMPLQQAMARAKKAILLEPNQAYYRKEWNKILDMLMERSPLIEDDEIGRAFVGLDGLERLYGSDANLVRALRSAVSPEIQARLGVASGKFPSYVAALAAGSNRALKLSTDVPAFLASKTVKVLPVPWETKERLLGFGLRKLGQIASQRISPLQAQFGPTGRLMWELAQGIDPRPLNPRQTQTLVYESLSFPTPTANIEPVLLGARKLLQKGFRDPLLKGRFARVASLQGEVLNGRPWTRRIPFHEATGNAERAFFSVKVSLDRATLPGPLETLSLTLSGITGEAGIQSHLFENVQQNENLAESIRQVRAATNNRIPIYQVQEMEPWSRHPEERHALVEYAV